MPPSGQYMTLLRTCFTTKFWINKWRNTAASAVVSSQSIKDQQSVRQMVYVCHSPEPAHSLSYNIQTSHLAWGFVEG